MTIAPGFRAIPTMIAFILVALLLHFTTFNTSLFLLLNHLGGLFPDDLWALLSYMGDGLVVVVLILPLTWRYPRLLWAGVIALLLASSSIAVIKDFFYSERPLVALPGETFNIIGLPLTYLSFPSGHSATSFLIAVILMHYLQLQRATQWLLAWASLVAISRIMVGAHFPVDILGGAVLGIMLGWISLRIADKWPWGETLWGRRVLLPIFLWACVMLYDSSAGFSQFLCLSRLLAVFIGAFALYYWYVLWRYPVEVSLTDIK